MDRLELVSPAILSLAAFSALVERHSRPLHAFLCSFVRDPELARDLLQDTFCDAWDAAQRGMPPLVPDGGEPNMRRWLYRVAYRRAVDDLRHRSVLRWESLDERDDEDTLLCHPPDLLENVIAEMEAMQRALANLDPADVSCLLLTVVHRFTAAEAAHIIGASPQAVAKRVSRAKRRLLASYLAQNPASSETSA